MHYNSPLGGILLAADGIGLTGLWFDGEKYYADNLPQEREVKETSVLSEAARWLDIYFAGKEPDFTPPLHPIGSEFSLCRVEASFADTLRYHCYIRRYCKGDCEEHGA